MHAHRVFDNFSPLPANLPTSPQLLQKAGYRTGFFGKWHMGGDSDERQPGFDDWLSFRGQGDDRNPPDDDGNGETPDSVRRAYRSRPPVNRSNSATHQPRLRLGSGCDSRSPGSRSTAA